MTEPLRSRVQAALEPHLSGPGVPGAVTVISQRGRVQAHVLGAADLGSQRPLQRDSIFRISSMSKPITSAAALLLADRGIIGLDDPIHHWLPELAERRVLRELTSPLNDTVPAERPVSVRDLLSCTDGFGQLYGSPADYPIVAAALELDLRMGPPAPAAQPAADEWLARLGSLPLMRQPGHSWLYDTATDVLSVLISRAAGMEFASFLHENLFRPLGMTDTGFSVPVAEQHRFVTAYAPNPAGGAPLMTDDPRGGQWSTAPAFASGAAGLVSTCDDYLAFAAMLLDQGRHGGQRILSAESVRLLTTSSLTDVQQSRSLNVPLDFRTHSWGMGLAVVKAPGQSWPAGSYGWTGGLGTDWHTNPQEQLITVVMTQLALTSPDSGQLFDDVAAAVQADA